MLVLTLSNQLGNANTVLCDLGQNFGISPNWGQVQAYSIGGDVISPASLSEGWIKLQQPRASDGWTGYHGGLSVSSKQQLFLDDLQLWESDQTTPSLH